jgi:hypothetical protein
MLFLAVLIYKIITSGCQFSGFLISRKLSGPPRIGNFFVLYICAFMLIPPENGTSVLREFNVQSPMEIS